MPLVFVHGVATRQTPKYRAEVEQRDALFRRLVMGQFHPIFDPDWGSGAVRFAKGGWVPEPGADEAFSMGAAAVADGASVAAAVAASDRSPGLDLALDLAFGALLAERAAAGQPLSEAELAAFEAGVKYLEDGGDKTAFSGRETDSQFVATLEDELAPFAPQPPQAGPAAEGMGAGGVFSAIGKAVKTLTDPLRNGASDAGLRLVRVPLSKAVATFLGDIFVYLRWRQTDGDAGTYNRIFKPIVTDVAEAARQAGPGDKLVVVAHSLGAVILYDLLTDDRALQAIEAAAGKPLAIDAWITVGAQPGLFADMGLYDRPTDADGKLARPACVKAWLNVFDYTDVLSFRTTPFFSGVEDFSFDNVSGALEAHTAYFQRPAFYKRLRARLNAL
ncbi:MAG: hypothetical protein Q7T61_10105 [Caulobacter sp.]|nr:hypothetical protein [Caulobacter sp.]